MQSFNILLNILKIFLIGQHFLFITDHRALVWIYSFRKPDNTVARWINLGNLTLRSSIEQAKKLHADCLSRMNTEDNEQRAFVSGIAMEAGQENTDHGSRSCQLDKLQRVKLRDSQRFDKLLKEV